MEKENFLRYDRIDGNYWMIFKNDEITPGKEKSILIGTKVAIFYDHEIGKIKYCGNIEEVKEKIHKLIVNQKKAENELGFFLTSYKYYELEDIEINVLNKIINEKGFFPKELEDIETNVLNKIINEKGFFPKEL